MKSTTIAVAMVMCASTGCAVAQGKGNGNAAGGSGAGNLSVPVLVDGTGKVVGRYVGTQVLVTYNNDVLPVGLGYIPDANGSIASSAWTWSYSQLYYQSSDCTGTAHVTGVSGGRTYVAVQPQGNQFVGHLAQSTVYAPVLLRSYRSPYGSCETWGAEGNTLPASPVRATIPMDSFGVPPFFVQ